MVISTGLYSILSWVELQKGKTCTSAPVMPPFVEDVIVAYCSLQNVMFVDYCNCKFMLNKVGSEMIGLQYFVLKKKTDEM